VRAVTTARSPRRLTREARRRQLIELAMPIVAEQGFTEFSLEELADRAGVTRNLLYRYFPRGRPDIAAAVVRDAGHELTRDWVTDPSHSLEERLLVNTERVADHAFEPSSAWRIHRKARAADQPEITEVVNDYLDTVVANIALNNVGTADPPARVRIAILGFISFAETVVDEARNTDVSRAEIGQLLIDTLVVALASARAPGKR
jgi:AcrR family transcriptional regulator